MAAYFRFLFIASVLFYSVVGIARTPTSISTSTSTRSSTSTSSSTSRSFHKPASSTHGVQHRPYIAYPGRKRRWTSDEPATTDTKRSSSSGGMSKRACVDLEWLMKRMDEKERKREEWSMDVLKKLKGLWILAMKENTVRNVVKKDNIVEHLLKDGSRKRNPTGSERVENILQSLSELDGVDGAASLRQTDDSNFLKTDDTPSSSIRGATLTAKRSQSTKDTTKKNNAKFMKRNDASALKKKVEKLVGQFVDQLMDQKTDIVAMVKKGKSSGGRNIMSEGTHSLSTPSSSYKKKRTKKISDERLENVVDLLLDVLE